MITISIIAVILAVGAGAAAYLYYHPQIIISGIQKMLYKEGIDVGSSVKICNNKIIKA